MSDSLYSRYGFSENQFTAPKRDTHDIGRVGDGATLFLYGPVINKFGKTALYTRTYNFDDSTFANNIERVVTSVVDSQGGQAASVGAGVNPYDQFTYTQRPEMTLEGDRLSQHWTFTLIFTGKNNRIRSEDILTTSAVSGLDRTIYTGVCDDVPLIQSNGKEILNPKCVLRVLHKNKTAIDVKSGRTGDDYSLRGKHTDWVFDSTMFQGLTSDFRRGDLTEHHLTPAKVAGGVRCDEGAFYPVAGLSTEIKPGAKLMSSDMTDDPKTHLSSVTRGIAELLKWREHSKSTFADSDFLPTHDEDAPDYVSDQFASALHIPTSGNYTREDLDITGRVTLGDLDRDFVLKVYPKTFENSTQYGADSMTDGIVNKLSYELGTITAIIANRLGISNVQFVYATETGADRHVRDSFRITRIGFIYNIKDFEAARLRNLLETELRQGILGKIRKVGGDFHVMVRANTSDISTVRLNLLSSDQKNTVDYVIPSILGGLVSATIGSIQDSTHNVNRLCGLAEQFSGGIDPDMRAFDRMNSGPRDGDAWDRDVNFSDMYPNHTPRDPAPAAPAPQAEPQTRAPTAPKVGGNWNSF